ncbi:MAG: hypothetical protein GXY98_02355, partial [Erysipelothrix sp.]|nr:hypothetical protein [Erysipelothrix sp.]
MQKTKNNQVLKTLGAVALLLLALTLLIQCTSSAKVFDVTYNSDGGSSVATESVKSGEMATMPQNPVKNGYKFLYWELNDEKYDFSSKVTSDISLKAVYESLSKRTVKLNYGNVVQEIIMHEGLLKEPINPIKEGYTFKHWELNGQVFDFSSPIVFDVELVAIWETTTYAVRFNSNGGSFVPNQTVVYGGKLIQPINPTQEGYNFVGWFLFEEAYDFSKVLDKDLELVAKWEAINPDDGVVTTKTETKNSVVTYKTVRQNDSTLDEGKTVIKQKGQNGEVEITYTVTYKDGQEPGRVEVSRKVIK